MLALPITCAIVPALLLLWYFHSRDAYPEPPRVVWATFFLGVLSIPAVLLIAVPAGHLLTALSSPYQFGLAEAFVCAAIPEELFKFLVLSGYAARHIEFNEPMDGVVYGVAASLGFATLENIMYVGHGGLGVGIMRAFTAVPGHAFTGAVMGYYVGRARFANSELRGGLYGLAVLAPILLHGFYDFPLLIVSRFKKLAPRAALPGLATLLVLVSLLTLIVEWRLALRLVRRLRAEQDADRGAALPIAPPLALLIPMPVAGPIVDPFTAPVAAPIAAAVAVGVAPIAAAASARRKNFSFLGWVQVLVGGALLTGAGLFVVLLVTALATGGGGHDVKGMVVGGVVLCGLPTLAGLGLFRSGIRRLNRAESGVPSVALG